MTISLLRLVTSAGTIEIEVYDSVAPQTTRFVRRLVEAGQLNGSAFYRSTTLGVEERRPLIQGGPLAPMFTGSTVSMPRIDLLESIESTATTGLRHCLGTVSLARDLITTGHVLPELFICLDDYPELDAGGRTEPDELGFPAFGVVTSGLDVVASIAAGARGGASPVASLAGQILSDPIVITNAAISSNSDDADTANTVESLN